MPIPYLTLAKWIGAGLLALFVIGAIARVITVVNGWHQDSQALPQVTAARDKALVDRDSALQAKAKQETKFAGTLDTITAAITNLQAKFDALAMTQSAAAARVDRALDHFKEMTANVASNAPLGSPDDLLVRRELFNLLANPDTGQLGRGGTGDSQGQPRAGVPGAAVQPDNVPGRSGAASDQSGAVVPTAGKSGRSHLKRTAQGRRRRGNRLGTAGATRQVPAERLGQAVPGFWGIAVDDDFAIASRRIPRRGGGHAYETVVRYGQYAGEQVVRHCGAARG